MLSRVFDGLTDPIIGFASDRANSRWGRRKPFFLLGMPLYIAGVWLLWIPPFEFYETSFMGLEFNIGYPYLLAALVLMYVGATIKDVPYSAWGAELSANYNERTLIMSWKEGFSVAGSLIGAFTPAVVFFFGYTRPVEVVSFLAMAVAIIMPILVLNCLWSVPEFPAQETKGPRLPLRESFRYVWRNEPYRKLVIIFLFSTIGSAMTNSLSFFFVKHVLLAGDLYGFLPCALFHLADHRDSAVVQTVAAHRQTSRHHGGNRLVQPVVVLHTVDRDRTPGLVHRFRDSKTARLSARRHAPGNHRLLSGHTHRQVRLLHLHHVFKGLFNRSAVGAALCHGGRRG